MSGLRVNTGRRSVYTLDAYGVPTTTRLGRTRASPMYRTRRSAGGPRRKTKRTPQPVDTSPVRALDNWSDRRKRVYAESGDRTDRILASLVAQFEAASRVRGHVG